MASAAICGGVEHLGRIARNSPRGAQCGPATDLKWARRCGLVAGIAALFAAPLSYVNRTTTPTAGGIATQLSSLGKQLAAIRTDGRYGRTLKRIKQLARKTPLVGEMVYGLLHAPV